MPVRRAFPCCGRAAAALRAAANAAASSPSSASYPPSVQALSHTDASTVRPAAGAGALEPERAAASIRVLTRSMKTSSSGTSFEPYDSLCHVP